jgi:hypothetical protein
MKNNMAQFFGMYLIVLTLFLCVVSILTYSIQQENIHSSLISPNEIISIQIDLEMFEIREVQIIENSLEGVEGDFPNSQFRDNFRNKFLAEFKQEGEMKEFIFNHLTVDGVDVEKSARVNSDIFFENVLYNKLYIQEKNDAIYFSRGLVGKKINMVGKPTKINFPVNLTYEFKMEYLINFSNGKYVVRKI